MNISQLIRFARASSHVTDFNCRNKALNRCDDNTNYYIKGQADNIANAEAKYFECKILVKQNNKIEYGLT